MSRKQERRYTSAKKWADQQERGASTPYLKLPDKAPRFKPKEGTMLLDIIPYEVGEGNPFAEQGQIHWERTFWIHKGIGANSESYLCAAKTNGSKCPVCELRKKLQREGDEDNEALIKELAPKQRQLLNVIDRKDPDKGVQVWELSYHLFGRELEKTLHAADEDEGWDKFFFLEDGLTLRVSMTEESFGGRRFLKAERIDFKPRKDDYDESILDEAHMLDDMLVETDYDKLKEILLEVDDDKDDDDEEKPRSKRRHEEEEDDEGEESPRRKSSKDTEDGPTRKKRKSDEDEDDDAEDEDDEEKPKKKGKAPSDEDSDWDEFDAKAKKSKSKKDDDDEEDSEDEEEEEAPKKKRRPSEEDEEEDYDEEEEEKPRKKSKKDDDEEEEDEWDEEEKPRVKTKAQIEDEEEEEERPRKKRK